MWRGAHAVKTRSFNLVLAGQRSEAVPSEESWRHNICLDVILVIEDQTHED